MGQAVDPAFLCCREHNQLGYASRIDIAHRAHIEHEMWFIAEKAEFQTKRRLVREVGFSDEHGYTAPILPP